MAQAVTGTTFTFQVLFLDAVNNPIVVNNPLITVFHFTGAGVKEILVNAAALTPVGGDVGRYTYPYAIGALLPDGDILYAQMTGVDPGSGLTLLVQQDVTVIATAASGGMTTRFVKGG
jgi:hypothetical protein